MSYKDRLQLYEIIKKEIQKLLEEKEISFEEYEKRVRKLADKLNI